MQIYTSTVVATAELLNTAWLHHTNTGLTISTTSTGSACSIHFGIYLLVRVLSLGMVIIPRGPHTFQHYPDRRSVLHHVSVTGGRPGTGEWVGEGLGRGNGVGKAGTVEWGAVLCTFTITPWY